MVNKHAHGITVQATVVNKDTICYGGSAFIRERTCRYETFQEPEGGAIWDECSNCGIQFWCEQQYNIADHFTFCPGCRALIERGA